MNSLLRALIGVGLAVASCASAFAGPFGLSRGMTRDQIVQLVGKDAVVKEKPNAEGGEALTLKTAPKPHRQFEEYVLFIAKDGGLLKIVAVSKDCDTSEDGSDLNRQYQDLKSSLVSVYGVPTNDFDFVRSGSDWDESKYFMMGLLKKDRTLAVDWVSGKGITLKDDISLVNLEAQALSLDKGYLVLMYEFNGWDAYVDKLKAKESAVF